MPAAEPNVAALDSATKAISAAVPLAMVIWFRYLFQALATGLVLAPRRGRALWRTIHPGLQLLRGALLTLSSTLAFLSLRYMPVAEFTAVMMLTPLAVTLLAGRTLGEPVPALRWALLGGGFAGALLVIRPGGAAFHWASLLPLGMVACNTLFQVLTSRLAKVEHAGTMHFWTGCTGNVLAALALPFSWQALASPGLWGVLVAIAALGTIGHYLLILGHGRAPASLLTPYLYVQVGFATLFGAIAFGHRPDAIGWLGLLLITACGVLGTRFGLPAETAPGAPRALTTAAAPSRGAASARG